MAAAEAGTGAIVGQEADAGVVGLSGSGGGTVAD